MKANSAEVSEDLMAAPWAKKEKKMVNNRDSRWRCFVSMRERESEANR